MRIGSIQLDNPVLAAPMAGVTDRPFRMLCRELGAGLAVSEMVSSDPGLRNSRKTRLRLNHHGEQGPVSVQIAGTEPGQMADSARFNEELGADIIDINMGCPAKKVCNKLAGSALMRDEKLVRNILEAVVESVSIPVTLKMRTGWDAGHRNAPVIAAMAEKIGVSAVTVHGRTRACMYRGEAEYETIRRVREAIDIPLIANGDIDSANKARDVLQQTGADGVMIGRAALGRPWLPGLIACQLNTPEGTGQGPTMAQKHAILCRHLSALHEFYGDCSGVRIARKHIIWTLEPLGMTTAQRRRLNTVTDPVSQLEEVDAFFAGESPERIAA